MSRLDRTCLNILRTIHKYSLPFRAISTILYKETEMQAPQPHFFKPFFVLTKEEEEEEYDML